MDRKMSIRKADILMRNLVCENLRKEINDFYEAFSDTEEWLLFLTAASNSESKKRFPMTPSDVSRNRKRLKVDTIVECVEEDETMSLSETLPVGTTQRESRTAFKLASLRMKEPNLNLKLRQPGTRILEEVPLERARKTKLTVLQADISLVTPESSFVRARSSLASDLCKRVKVEPMETEDEVVLQKVRSKKMSSYEKYTKKSSLRMKTMTKTRASKRATKQLVETVVESPAKCIAMRKSSPKKPLDSPAYDSCDDVPLINLVSNTTKPEKTELRAITGQGKISKSKAENEKKEISLIAIDGQVPILLLHRTSATLEHSTNPLNEITESQQNIAASSPKAAATDNSKKNCGDDAEKLGLIICEKDKSLVQIRSSEVAPAKDISFVDAPIVQENSKTKGKNVRSKVLSNATNRKTPESARNLINRHFEPVSVKKRVEAIEQDHFLKQVTPAKPDVPVRMTRTKVREMMASLTAVTAVPDKKPTRNIEVSHLLKIAGKSFTRAKKVSLTKERGEVQLQKYLEKENTSPLPNGVTMPKSICSTKSTHRATPSTYVHPSRLLAYMSTSQLSNTSNRSRTTPQSCIRPSHLLAPMSTSNQPLSNLSAISTFLPKTKVVSAAEVAEERRKEERRQRRENNEDALLKKKALIDDRIEQQRKKREEKKKNVLAQKALKEREMAEMKIRIEKENEEKARLVQEREEMLKKEILRKKEEAKQKAAKIEERRVRQEAERLQALKLQEEEQQKLLAQKRKEQEDAERLHARRLLEEKERKEKEAAVKEAALMQEAAVKKQNQMQKVAPTRTLDGTFNVEKPVLVAASKYDYPLLDLSMGNDSDYSDGEEDVIPLWAKREELVKNLKGLSGIPSEVILCYFGSKPTTPDLDEIFSNRRYKHVRSSSACWKTPPRCSMVPEVL